MGTISKIQINIRRINKKVLFIYFSFFLVSSVLYSCKKSASDTVPTPIPVNTDTAQSIYTVSVLNNPSPGNILISPFSNGTTDTGIVMIINQDGHVIKQKRLGGMTLNFAQWTVNGQIRYTYEVYDKNTFIIPGLGYSPGYEVITDSNLNEIQRVQLSSFGDISNTSQPSLDGHDFILIDDNHYILESYYQKTVTNIPASLNPVTTGVKVVAPVIQEVNNGVVIWQWDGTDHTEFYTQSLEENNFSDSVNVQDYMHINSMFIDPRDNNLICSFRNLDQIVKLDRSSGNIIWRLGGTNSDFPLNSDQVFLRQHHATLTDNNETLILFDDGYNATSLIGTNVNRAYSRIVEFNLDEVNKAIIAFKSFNIPEAFTQYMGSVQKKGDTYFIGGGTAGYVLEINYLTGVKTFELKSKQSFYRAYKLPAS